MGLLDTLGDIVAGLERAGIPYMVAGSVASTHHSEPRTTQNIDIVLDPERSALDAFLDALDRNQYYVGDATSAFDERGQFNVIDINSGWKVDLIMRRDRPFSLTELGRRQRVEIEGLWVQVASPEDTILAKLEWAAMSGSERQSRDVQGIVDAMGAELDLSYLRHWAGELGVVDPLEELIGRPASGEA